MTGVMPPAPARRAPSRSGISFACRPRPRQPPGSPPGRARGEGKLRISPIARRLADLAGLDVQALAAQHPGKRIEREDVEAALAAAGSARQRHPPLRPVALAPEPGKAAACRRPMSRLRRLIAERMVRSSSDQRRRHPDDRSRRHRPRARARGPQGRSPDRFRAELQRPAGQACGPCAARASRR